MTQLYIMAPIIILTIIILATSIKVLREYERGVTFTLGRFTSVKGPGLIILIPFVQTMNRVDLRTMVVDVPTQDVISKDNVSVKVNAVIYFKIVEPSKATSSPKPRCGRSSASTSSMRCCPSAIN